MLALAVTACTDGLLPSAEERAAWIKTFQLPPLEVTVCQYGGTPPDCKPAPPPTGAEAPGTGTTTGGGAGTSDGGGSSGTPTPTPPDTTQPDSSGIPCATGDPIIDSTAGQGTFQILWEMSNADAPDQRDRREAAGWIVRLSDGGYGFSPNLGPGTPCASAVSLDWPPNVVAFVHTHPFAIGEYVPICGDGFRQYKGIPSLADYALAEDFPHVPHYVIDKSRITRYDARRSNNVHHARCAY